MQWAAFVAAYLAAGPAAAVEDSFERKVEVDGSTYRVNVKRNVVTVAKKSLVVRYSIDERDKMRLAVKQATGCNVVDEIANGAKLKGKLLCDEP